MGELEGLALALPPPGPALAVGEAVPAEERLGLEVVLSQRLGRGVRELLVLVLGEWLPEGVRLPVGQEERVRLPAGEREGVRVGEGQGLGVLRPEVAAGQGEPVALRVGL